jgi:hypothetical protein
VIRLLLAVVGRGDALDLLPTPTIRKDHDTP